MKNINFSLCLLLFLIVISNIVPQNILFNKGEIGFIEIIQLLLILLSIVVILINRKKFIKAYNLKSFLLKILFYILIFYEEISFITATKNDFFIKYSNQNEINFHNLSIFYKTAIDFYLPIINYQLSISTYQLIIISALFILGFGNYISGLKEYRFLFFEKNNSIYTFIYLSNILISSLIKTFLDNNYEFLSSELLELFIYILLTKDLLIKKNNIDISNSKNVILKI